MSSFKTTESNGFTRRPDACVPADSMKEANASPAARNTRRVV
jgi:hypothetical protein